MMHPSLRIAGVLACAGSAALLLSGCGTGVSPIERAPVTVSVGAATGLVMGGQQPVAGVTMQLYQAGATGYGSLATKLGSTVLTNSNGNFTLPSYTCTAGSQVYLVGTGGQPIAATGTAPAVTNNNLALMVGLGLCGGANLNPNGFINVNELTTVASVWALAPFMSGIGNIGSSSTNATGLANAFAAINQIVTISTGQLPGPTLPTGATLPITEINTLADILEQCINSGGGVQGDGSSCGNLFNLTPNAAGNVYPTDTITAMMNMAQSPGRNVTALDRLRSSSPVFQPALNVNFPPTDWTIAITYVGGGLSTPSSIAVDAAGSVWVTNKGNSSVTKLDYSGAAVSTASGFTLGGINSPTAIAVDSGGNAWVANGNNTITQLSSTGISGTALGSNGLSAPSSIAIDGSGNVWIANSTDTSTVSAFTSGGARLTGSPYSGAGSSAPVSIAVTPK
jgi:hypothetical protein